jgi:hypothetical protein
VLGLRGAGTVVIADPASGQGGRARQCGVTAGVAADEPREQVI